MSLSVTPPLAAGRARRTRTTARAAARALVAALAVAASTDSAATGEDMVRIEPGRYVIGSGDGRASARPAHEVALDAFSIDRFEVTNGDFAAFLNALDIRPLGDRPYGRIGPGDLEGTDAGRVWGGASGNPGAYIELDDVDARIEIRDRRFVAAAGREDHPVTESTWLGALAYCRSRGARLPTEAEWEAAARGGEGRTYPWGESPPGPERAAFGRRRGETAPVDSHPQGATPEGLHHLAGNVAEWTSSLFRPYPYRAGDGREDPEARGERVTRGGDYLFDTSPDRLTTYFRDGFSRAPDRGHRHIGFRCARHP